MLKRKSTQIDLQVPSEANNDFSAFDTHAALIESVAHDILRCPIKLESIEPSLFAMLQAIRPGHTLLPKLKILRYLQPDLLRDEEVLPFLSTRLKSLALDVKDDCTGGLLASAFSLSPSITDISLSGLLTDTLLAALRYFTRLSVLSLRFNKEYYDQCRSPSHAGLGPQVFSRALSAAFKAMEKISSLQTFSYNIPFEPLSTPAPNGSWTRGVRNLRLDAPPIPMQQHLPAFSNLVTASLDLQRSVASSIHHDFLGDCCRLLGVYSGQYLQAVSITCHCSLVLPVFEHIQPLMRASSMRAFSLRVRAMVMSNSTPYLRHSDAVQIASHWPSLEELILIKTGLASPLQQVAPKFHDLLPLARLTALKNIQIQGLPPPENPFRSSLSRSVTNPVMMVLPWATDPVNHQHDDPRKSYRFHNVLCRAHD